MSRPSLLVATVLAALALSASACGDSTDRAEAGADGSTADRSTTSTPSTSSTSSTMADEGVDGSDADDDEATPTDAKPDSDTDGATDETVADADATKGQEQPTADVTIVGSLSQGELMVEDRRVDVPIGSSVLITFESDQVEHIHLHGYDLLADLVPGQPAEIAFVADSPGSFEVELEDSGRFLFELLVR